MSGDRVQVACQERGCHEVFWVEADELASIRARGWKLPRRCRRCRIRNRPLRGGMWHPLGGEYQRFI